MLGNFTPLEKLGKFPLLGRLNNAFQAKPTSLVPYLGEDTAIIDVGHYYQLLTNRLLLEGIHFDLTYVPLKHLGYKAVAISIADTIAMNGVPEHVLVHVSVSKKFSVEAIEEIFIGIDLACEKYRITLIKTDITSSVTGLVVAITAVGKVSKDKICLRKGAKVHDIICVTGDLGSAYMGLQVLNREKKVFQVDPNMQPDLSSYQYLVQRQLKPEARVDIIATLHRLQIQPTAMINVADGLASDLLHIADASQVGLLLYEERLPIHQITYETAVDLNLNPTTCAVNGGEDYELVFMIDQKDAAKLEQHPDIAFVGYVTDQSHGINLLTSGGHTVPLVAPGWQGANA